MRIHFDEMQVNRDKGDYIPSDKDLAELYDEYEHYERGKAERPQGEWKALNYHTCYCTNCHFDFDIMKCDFMAKMQFCPNCGAKMIKERNSESSNRHS